LQTQLFSPETGKHLLVQRFENLPYGKLRSILPIAELASLLPEQKSKEGGVGATPWFDNAGKIALQFLKIKENCSDEDLRIRINTNWSLQLFCGFLLEENEEIKDKNLIWRIRAEVSEALQIDTFQEVLIKHWKPYMDNTHLGLTDATVYESYIKYPTDVKLLWDCVQWVNKQIKYFSKKLHLRRPRNKFKDQKQKNIAYSKKRRKTNKEKKRRRRQLLYLLNKMLFQLLDIIEHGFDSQTYDGEIFSEKMLNKYMLIGKIYEQQNYLFQSGQTSVPDRIVSLYKPYLRPIVRGKENKRVEFGAKLNTWQVGGLNFIEYLSFSAFHEGIRLKKGITFHHKHFGKLKQVGADALYGTNKNRKFCTTNNITTCFKPKGRRTQNQTLRKQQDQATRAISKARSTVLEGSYGNDKNHYNLRKVKARNKKTEIAWIFFGMMTANAKKVVALKEKAEKQIVVAA